MESIFRSDTLSKQMVINYYYYCGDHPFEQGHPATVFDKISVWRRK